MRTTIICIVLAACSSTYAPTEETETDPACAGEAEPSAHSDELPWDLDRDPVSDVSDCPDCDALPELDAPDEDYVPTWEPDVTTWGLTDPLTSTGKSRAWPNGRIPYKLATTNGVVQINSATRTALSQAMTNWEQLTEGRIKFRPKQASDVAYVIVKQGSPRVGPFVGYRKDQVSTLYLRDSEYLTVTKHELGHVIGLHHEQRRTDRLSFIKVRSQYIVDSDNCRYQFATCSTCKPLGTYDRNSVMHYRTHDLPGCRTGSVLLDLDGTAISHVWKVSPKDLTSVAKMYATTTPPPQPPTEPTTTLPESGSITSGALCTAVADDNTLELHTCDGAGDQDWRLTSDGQLRVQDTLQCAAVVGCSYVDAPIEQAACSATALDQKWSFLDMALVHGVTGKCITSALTTAACTVDDSQAFAIHPDRETIEIADKCLTAQATTVALAACDGSPAQQWFQGRGGFVTRANTAKCLRVDGAGKVGLADCTDGVEQRFALRGEIRDARSELCLGAAGAKLVLAACDGTQRFTLWSR
jgi:hypothetical protein